MLISTNTMDINTVLSIRDYIPERDDKTICIVIDVLRASSTIISLLDNGCRRVYTVAEEEQARQMGFNHNMITSGEWQGIKLSGFDMDNSPAEAMRFPVTNRDVVLCTSNGTRVIHAAKDCVELFIASMLNIRSCAVTAVNRAKLHKCGITIVCAGQYGSFVLDDAYCAGYLLQEINLLANEMGIKLSITDSCRAAKALLTAYPDARAAFNESASGQTLLAVDGREDFEFCLKINTSSAVPYMQIENNMIWFINWQNEK